MPYLANAGELRAVVMISFCLMDQGNNDVLVVTDIVHIHILYTYKVKAKQNTRNNKTLSFLFR